MSDTYDSFSGTWSTPSGTTYHTTYGTPTPEPVNHGTPVQIIGDGGHKIDGTMINGVPVANK